MKKTLVLACSLCIIAVSAMAQGFSPATQSGKARFGAVSFFPPNGWSELTGRDLSDMKASLKDRNPNVVAVYRDSQERGYLVLTDSRLRAHIGSDQFLRELGTALSRQGAFKVEYNDVETANTVVPTLRAWGEQSPQVILKSLVEISGGKLLVLDFMVSREAFNDVAPELYDSIQSITVGRSEF